MYRNDFDAMEIAVSALAEWAGCDAADIAGESEFGQTNGRSPLELPDGRAFHIFPVESCMFETESGSAIYLEQDESPPATIHHGGKSFFIYREFVEEADA